MSGGSDADRVQRDYRTANETLDERPTAATRASILAAAAREVRAVPRDAREPIAAPGPGLRRWPMAAAAAVLLSTLAVMMAVRTEHEMPTFTRPTDTESRAPAAAPATAPPGTATESVQEQRVEDRALDATPRTAPSLAKERVAPPVATTPAAPPASASTSAGRDAASAREESKVTAPIAEPRAKKDETAALRAPEPPPLPPAAPPTAGQRAAAAPPGESGFSSEASAPAPVGEQRRRDEGAANAARAPARQAPSTTGALGAAADKPRAEADAVANELRADDWLERIIRLRNAARHDEADAELKRFRERYPQVQVPAEALPPSGTR